MNSRKIIYIVLIIAFAFPLLAYNVSGQGSTGTDEFPIDFVSLGIGGVAGLAGGLLSGWFIGRQKLKTLKKDNRILQNLANETSPSEYAKEKKKDKEEAKENKKEYVGHVSLMK